MLNVLNLYCGIGGNRKLWENVDVTAVDYSSKIAEQYQRLYPQDTVVCADAHDYLLKHYQDYDFIWSSPPCQSHSRMIRGGKNRKPRYPDLKLYEEILFLQHNYAGGYVVENVIPYYTPLIPAQKIGRHLFWCNFRLPEISLPTKPKDFINTTTLEGMRAMMDWLGIHYDKPIYYEGNHCPAQILRNAVHPEIGKAILDQFCQEFQPR